MSHWPLFLPGGHVFLDTFPSLSREALLALRWPYVAQLKRTGKFLGRLAGLTVNCTTAQDWGPGQKGGGRERDYPTRTKETGRRWASRRCMPSSSEAGTVGCVQAGLGWARLLAAAYSCCCVSDACRARAGWGGCVVRPVSETAKTQTDVMMPMRIVNGAREVIPHCDSRSGLSSSYKVTPICSLGSTTAKGMAMSGRENGGGSNSTNGRAGQSNAVWQARVGF